LHQALDERSVQEGAPVARDSRWIEGRLLWQNRERFHGMSTIE